MPKLSPYIRQRLVEIHVMYFVALSVLLNACRSEGIDQIASQTKIVGGTVPTLQSPGLDSTVALVDENASKQSFPVCSGVLIAPRLVLTAAHCLEKIKRPVVVFKKSNHNSIGTIIKSVSSQVFNRNSFVLFPNFDIAWIKLERDAPEDWTPIEILRSSKYLKDIEQVPNSLILAGFGQTASDCESKECKGNLLEVRTHLNFFVNTPYFINLMVVGPNMGKGSCEGDSGGPAFIRSRGRWLLAGILNGKSALLNTPALWKEGVCESGEAIYTFAGAYVDWIEKSSGVKLFPESLTNNSDAVGAQLMHPMSLGLDPTLEEMLHFDNYNESVWLTLGNLISEFRNPALRQGYSMQDLAQSPELSAKVMRTWTEFSHLGFAFDFNTAREKLNQISDARPIAALISLKKLTLDSNRLENLKLFSNLENLEELNLRNNYDFNLKKVVPWDLSFIGSLKNLKRLDLSHNSNNLPLHTIAWTQLASLEELDLSNNKGSVDLAAIPWARLSSLKRLTIRSSGLVNIQALSQSRSLEKINLSGNKITNIKPLSELPNLLEVNLSGNPVEDLSSLKDTINVVENICLVPHSSNLSQNDFGEGISKGQVQGLLCPITLR